jgi:hypothetical protein
MNNTPLAKSNAIAQAAFVKPTANAPILATRGPVQFNWDYSDLDDDLRVTIRNYVMQIKDCSRKLIQNNITVGNALIAVKARLKYGQFHSWCEAEFSMSKMTAERLMTLAEQAHQNPQIVDSGFGLSILYQLTAPSVTPEVQKAVTSELALFKSQGLAVSNTIASNAIATWQHQAEVLTNALDKATPEVLEVVEKYKVTDGRTVEALGRLQVSEQKPGSSGTFSEVLATGLIQPGEEEEAVPINAEFPFIAHALKLKSKDHALISLGKQKPKLNRGADQYVPILSTRAVITALDGLTITLKLDIDPANIGIGEIVRCDLFTAKKQGKEA